MSQLTGFVAKKHGVEVMDFSGTVRPDGVVEVRRGRMVYPLVLWSECDRLGISRSDVTFDGPAACLAKVGSNPGGIEILPAV